MFPIADLLVAYRARRIADPIERLRYLRYRPVVRLRPSHLLLLALMAGVLLPARSVPRTAVRMPELRRHVPRVWLAGSRAGAELYSNGLRIETGGAVRHHQRRFRVYAAGRDAWQDVPAGIVFHSTESDLLAFEPGNSQSLQRTSESLLQYVRRKRSYHYLIDRFGQVHRVVAESDSADHAGNAAWAWGGRLTLNLNHAFLGVSFEARTGKPLSAAQVHAGKVLTEWLRERYDIPAENCVAHAQVSFNPANRRMGWHTDWSRDLPFAALGLPDNYRQPLAGITDLGFEYDPAYLHAAGEGLWVGIHRSESELKRLASQSGQTVPALRRRLMRRYDDLSKKGIL